MSDSIAGYTALGFDGNLQRAAMEAITESRPGVSYEDRQLIGVKPKSSQITGHFAFSTADSRESSITAIFALKQTFVALVLHGRTYYPVLVEDVEEIDRYDALVATGNLYRVSFRFSLKKWGQ